MSCGCYGWRQTATALSSIKPPLKRNSLTSHDLKINDVKSLFGIAKLFWKVLHICEKLVNILRKRMQQNETKTLRTSLPKSFLQCCENTKLQLSKKLFSGRFRSEFKAHFLQLHFNWEQKSFPTFLAFVKKSCPTFLVFFLLKHTTLIFVPDG